MTIEKVSNCRMQNLWLPLIGNLVALAENPIRVKNTFLLSIENQ